MRKSNYLKLTVAMLAIFALVLSACSNSNNKPAASNQPAASSQPEKPSTVEITDAHGTVTVPVNPKKCNFFG